jgi:ribulose-phosphate 3-epimerase
MQSPPGLLVDISLWSADLTHLADDLKRLEPHAESFHLDAADGHFVPTLLFFPDLVAQLRPLTEIPFHLHLMATRPQDLLPQFLEAGVNRVTIPFEVGKRVKPALEMVRAAGRAAGISLDLETPVEAVKPFLSHIDTVVMMGTAVGVKGLGLDDRACDRIREVKKIVPPSVRVIADGAIREHTVPLLRDAGADGIVPGSLICASPDLEGTMRWLRTF